MLQVLVILAGLHLMVGALHQMFLFQHEFPHLDDHSLPNMGPDHTLLGSRALLWGFHPFIAALIALQFDSSLPAPLVFLFDSLFWAALVLVVVVGGLRATDSVRLS